VLNDIFKSAIIQTLVPIVIIAVIGRTLFLSLKYGVVVGGIWQKKIYRNETPVLYWFCVICLMCTLCCCLFLLIIMVKAYYFPPKLFKPPN
jgi:hypothetical protein